MRDLKNTVTFLRRFKLSLRVIFIGIIILIILVNAAYMLVMFKGADIITSQLKGLMQRKVTLGYINVSPPFNIEIRDLNIEGLGKIGSINVSPSILYLLTGKIALKVRLVNPEFIFHRAPPVIIGPIPEEKVKTPAPAPAAIAKKNIPVRVVLKKVAIKEGKLTFIDHTVSQEGIKIEIQNINCYLTNLYLYRASEITNFSLTGSIPWQEGQEAGKLSLNGWINLFKKDMQATFKVEGIDGVYLYPYYSKWVDLEGARIEKAKLNFSADLQGLNNEVTGTGHLELTDMVRSPLPEGQSQEKAAQITDAVLEIFRVLNQGKIALDFPIKTRMDRPEFNFDAIREAFESKVTQSRSGLQVEDVLLFPGKVLESAVRTAAGLTMAVIDGSFAVGNELKDAVTGSLKKENK